jgi:DNA-binding NarL/FixJ family response regulator
MESKIEMLSEREQEIVKCVAKGMANKEIADTLCLSVHTVTTHRRNLCNKLGIHSPAGLTIFCIINNLVKIDEIKTIK